MLVIRVPAGIWHAKRCDWIGPWLSRPLEPEPNESMSLGRKTHRACIRRSVFVVIKSRALGMFGVFRHRAKM